MDCRDFRNKHVAFVDDLLSAMDMRAMAEHRATCVRCSRHDTAIRRSLLIVHNLPTIEPSPDFIARLNQRLENIDAERVDVVAPRPYVRFAPTATTVAALAAGVMAVAYMAMETTNYYAPEESAPAATVASVPMLDPEPVMPIANPAIVASVPTGIPVWPAVLMAGQSPLHFASLDFHDGESDLRSDAGER